MHKCNKELQNDTDRKLICYESFIRLKYTLKKDCENQNNQHLLFKEIMEDPNHKLHRSHYYQH